MKVSHRSTQVNGYSICFPCLLLRKNEDNSSLLNVFVKISQFLAAYICSRDTVADLEEVVELALQHLHVLQVHAHVLDRHERLLNQGGNQSIP